MAATRDPRYDEDKRTRARALYDEGSSVREVAEALGVSSTRAWTLLQEAGADMREQGRPRKDQDEQTE